MAYMPTMMYSIYCMVLGESSCPNGSEYVWQGGYRGCFQVRSESFLFFIYKMFVLIILLLSSQAFSEDLRIKINSGQVEPLPIAIANFTGEDGGSSKIGMQISTSSFQ